MRLEVLCTGMGTIEINSIIIIIIKKIFFKKELKSLLSKE